MTQGGLPQDPSHFQMQPVEVLLKGGRSLNGTVHVPEGMPLLDFLGIREFFINLTTVREPGKQEEDPRDHPLEHLSLRLSNVVWVIPMESSFRLSEASAPVDEGRSVELHLTDGEILSVTLNIAGQQRMSDYLDANSGFVPLFEAKALSTSRVIEQLAVNHEAILAIREIPSF